MSICTGTFIVEGHVTYTLASGQVLTPIKLLSKYELDLDTGKLEKYNCYVDVTPLFLALGLCISNDENGNMKMEPKASPPPNAV